MSDSDISKLENKIDDLIQICDKLQDENELLKNRQSSLLDEKARLVEKTEQARNRVDSILSRLKLLEQDT